MCVKTQNVQAKLLTMFGTHDAFIARWLQTNGSTKSALSASTPPHRKALTKIERIYAMDQLQLIDSNLQREQ